MTEALKRSTIRATSSDNSVLMQIRMPGGRVVERVSKDTLAHALRAAGKKSAETTTKGEKHKD